MTNCNQCNRQLNEGSNLCSACNKPSNTSPLSNTPHSPSTPQIQPHAHAEPIQAAPRIQTSQPQISNRPPNVLFDSDGWQYQPPHSPLSKSSKILSKILSIFGYTGALVLIIIIAFFFVDK